MYLKKKQNQLFSVIILFFILIIKPLPSLLDPVGPVEQGADCQLHVDELRCLERCANRRWIRRRVEVAKYSELLLGFESKNACFFLSGSCCWFLSKRGMMTRNSTLTRIFCCTRSCTTHLDVSRSLMMLDSASRLICNGTFDEKRMAEEITFEMDFWSGFLYFLMFFFGGWEVWQCHEDGFLSKGFFADD